MALHTHAHDRDLGDLAVGDDAVEADLLAAILEQRLSPREIGLGHGEGDIGLALVATDVLDDHVDIDARLGERVEDMRHRAGPIGHAGEDDLGLVLVVRDAGHVLAFHFALLHQCVHFLLGDDHRPGVIVGRGRIVLDEAGEHLDADPLLHRQPDRAGLEDLGPDARQFEHFLIGHRAQLARLGDDPRIGGVDPVDIGVDVAAIGLDRRRHRHRRSVRAAAPQRGDAVVVGYPLEARDDRDLAALHRRDQPLAVDALDPRAGVALAGAQRQLPAQPAARRAADGLQRQRQQPGGHLFAAGDHDVVFRRIVERVGLAAEIDQPVGFARHRRDNHRDLIAASHLLAHDIGDPADALGPRHRRAAEFHHDPCQASTSCW